jgi:ABC-2 type transport system permease protein
MSKFLVIAAREYRTNVRTKAFLISLVLVPVLIGLSAAAPVFLKGRVDVEDKTIVVADGTGRALAALTAAAAARNEREVLDPKTGKKVEPRYTVVPAAAVRLDDDARVALSNDLRQRRIHAFAEIDADFFALPAGPERARARVHLDGAGGTELRRWFEARMREIAQRERFGAFGINPEVVAKASAPISIEVLGIYQRDELGRVTSASRGTRTAAMVAPVVVMFLVFMAIMMAQTMLQSTLEEKQQRIAEVLLGSVRPMELMAGKVIGSTAVSLTTMAVYLLAGLWFVHQNGYGGLIRHGIFAWALLFTALGVVIFGACFSAVGAACSELKEAQSFLMPIIMVLMVPLFVWNKLIEEPMSQFATTMSLVPLWTPLLMPLRLAASEVVPLWQPLLGVFVCVLLAVAAMWAGGRVFRVGLLLQGKPPKFAELVRWVVKG